MSHWNYRTVLVSTNVVLILVSLPNVALFLHWNRMWGIPDWLFLLGTEAMQVVIGTWCSMPLGLIMNQLCPKDTAATSYALLAGSSNLANGLSQIMGAYLLHLLAINPTGAPSESHQFDNLWIAGLISVVLPILPIVLIFCLIPNISQKENILGVCDATAGGDHDNNDNNDNDTISLMGSGDADVVDADTVVTHDAEDSDTFEPINI
jgi:hypothetical protein